MGYRVTVNSSKETRKFAKTIKKLICDILVCYVQYGTAKNLQTLEHQFSFKENINHGFKHSTYIIKTNIFDAKQGVLSLPKPLPSP